VISFNEVLEVSTSLAATSAVEFAPAIEPQSALMAPNPHRSVLRPGRAWVAFRRFRDIPQISKMAPMIHVAIGRALQFQLFRATPPIGCTGYAHSPVPLNESGPASLPHHRLANFS
jgi:hypothetical protein